MPCYHPISAFQCADGQVVFVERSRHDVVRSLFLPCGQCVGCRLERSRQWAVRCMHEGSLHESNSVVLLTYADEHLPPGGSLEYRDFQLFMKRLRKRFKDVRFFMCGEYGKDLGRPHFHAILFNVLFDDRVFLKQRPGGPLYRSATLERLWPWGHSTVGDLSFEMAAYIARYICEKVTGDSAPGWYQRVNMLTGDVSELEPEFCSSSLRPAIGRDWFRLFWPEVVQRGEVVSNGHVAKAPKYYDKLMSELAAFEDVEYRRSVKASLLGGENSDARLAVREVVAKARLSLSKRNSS